MEDCQGAQMLLQESFNSSTQTDGHAIQWNNTSWWLSAVSFSSTHHTSQYDALLTVVPLPWRLFKPSKLPPVVMFLTCIRGVHGSNFIHNTAYPDSDFPSFLLVPPCKRHDSTSIRPRPLPSGSFQIHYSLLIPHAQCYIDTHIENVIK
jgi:hypothetical protein